MKYAHSGMLNLRLAFATELSTGLQPGTTLGNIPYPTPLMGHDSGHQISLVTWIFVILGSPMESQIKMAKKMPSSHK